MYMGAVIENSGAPVENNYSQQQLCIYNKSSYLDKFIF